MSLKYIQTKNNLVITFPDGKNITLQNKTKDGRQALKFIKTNEIKGLENLVYPLAGVTEWTKGQIKVEKGRVKIGEDRIPLFLAKKILEFKKSKLPYKPLLKFWSNLKSNPSKASKENLYEFLEKNNYPITDNGNFIAYKKVTLVDGVLKDSYTKTIDNSVGKVVKMKRSEVDDNPEQTCSNGLHAAAWNYAYGFDGNVLVEVLVNPKNVVAVPRDYNAQKMRVCEYKVIRELDQSEAKERTELFVSEKSLFSKRK